MVRCTKFVGVVTRANSGLLFVPFGYADQVISDAKVHLGKSAGGAQLVEQVGNEGERISVFLCDMVETTVVYS